MPRQISKKCHCRAALYFSTAPSSLSSSSLRHQHLSVLHVNCQLSYAAHMLKSVELCCIMHTHLIWSSHTPGPGSDALPGAML